MAVIRDFSLSKNQNIIIRLIHAVRHTSVYENTRAWVPHDLQPCTEWFLLFFRPCNNKCTFCIKSEKVERLKHYSKPVPLNYCILIRQWCAVGTYFFCTRFASFNILAPLFLPSQSVSLYYFIVAVPMRECLGKRSCVSYTFPIAIMNGTFVFPSVKAMDNWKQRDVIYFTALNVKSFTVLKYNSYKFLNGKSLMPKRHYKF